MVKVKTQGVSTGFEPLPTGQYKATLVKYVEKPTKNPKAPPGALSFNTEWLITEPEEFAGRKVFISGSLQEEWLFAIKRVGVALGVDDSILEDEEGWDPASILPEYYGEQEVDLIITQGQPYNGKATNNVDVILEGERAKEAATAGGSWS